MPYFHRKQRHSAKLGRWSTAYKCLTKDADRNEILLTTYSNDSVLVHEYAFLYQ